MKWRTYAILALFLAVLLNGCATYSVTTIPIEQVPELKTGSPLAGISPLTFFISEFEDHRPFKDSVIMATDRGRMELNQKVSELITKAFANELRRNGHEVLRSNEAGNADVVIRGAVKKYWVESKPASLFSMRLAGMVEAEIHVTGQGSGKVLSKTYRGDYYLDGNSISFLIWRDILNQALLVMIREFSTDEAFLDSIRHKDGPRT